MMTEVVPQLRDRRYRFIKIRQKEKKPLEREWVLKNNYQYDDGKLLSHLAMGGNYGVLGGHGNLVIVDCDNNELVELVEDYLPRTFTVESGRGGKHFYYHCEDFGKPMRLRDCGTTNVGDVQAMGKQVVGPTSIHPNGRTYEVVDTTCIAPINRATIELVFGDHIIKNKERKLHLQDFERNDSLSITSVIPLGGLYKRGGDLQGCHPTHGSGTGENFTVNPTKNVAYCFRHSRGGGPLYWIAVIEGIIGCGDDLRGDKFLDTLDVAREKYGYEE